MRIRHSGTKIFQISTKDFSKQLYLSSNGVVIYPVYILLLSIAFSKFFKLSVSEKSVLFINKYFPLLNSKT